MSMYNNVYNVIIDQLDSLADCLFNATSIELDDGTIDTANPYI